MSENQNASADAAQGTAAPEYTAGGTIAGTTITGTQTVAGTATVDGAADVVANPSKRDWAEWQKTTRTIRDQNASLRDEIKSLKSMIEGKLGTKSPASGKDAPEASPTSDGVAEIRAELAIRDALDAAGVADAKHRKAITRLFSAERPGPGELDSWLNDTMDQLGMKKAAAEAGEAVDTAIPSPARTRSDTGAPFVAVGPVIPSHPSQVTQAQLAMMTPEQRKAHWEAYKRQSGMFEHPFAKMKQARQGNQSMAVAAKVIADALGRVGK